MPKCTALGRCTGIFIDAIGELIVSFQTFGEYQFRFEAPNQEPIIIPFYVAKIVR
jgi:hypothetical protein